MKRATVTVVDGIAGHDISIHALVKRATKPEMSFFVSGKFQSTPS